ncbi:hypothetical protein Cantr_00375 [Candida viswanathii]|uniref:Phosphoglycerate mutase n=1 Tax=Candida viswanathii TaxID=5486 RepID=A0A367YF67_9ASCO|nr:hypothetical protein Cantr_00375 [Candida viswanathii]
MSKSVPNPIDIKDGIVLDSDRVQYQELYEEYATVNPTRWEFSTVPGIFKQSLEETDESTFDTIMDHFGIIPTWDNIIHQLHSLNESSDNNVQYKLFFLARHGQGYHNVKFAEDPEGWPTKWRGKYTDGRLTWGPDPELTELGVEQARDNNKFWKHELLNNQHRNRDLIMPTRFFLSPMKRSATTLVNTWKDIVDLNEKKPVIQEVWRETIGTATCNQRRLKSEMAKDYEPFGFQIEPGFEEDDIYWKPDARETLAEQAMRQYKGLSRLFDDYPEDEIVSITSHGNSIKAQLMVFGHRAFAIGTGGFIPVFVKGVKVN